MFKSRVCPIHFSPMLDPACFGVPFHQTFKILDYYQAWYLYYIIQGSNLQSLTLRASPDLSVPPTEYQKCCSVHCSPFGTMQYYFNVNNK